MSAHETPLERLRSSLTDAMNASDDLSMDADDSDAPLPIRRQIVKIVADLELVSRCVDALEPRP